MQENVRRCVHSFMIGRNSPHLFCSSWDFSSFPTASFGLSVDGRLMGAFHAGASRKEPAVPLNSRLDGVREPVMMLCLPVLGMEAQLDSYIA